MSSDSWSIDGLDEPARAIGYLCIVYAFLEGRVSDFLGKLLNLEGDGLKCITNQVDMLRELSIVRSLGFLKQPSAQWYDDLDLAIWDIESRIMPKRNRFAHDRWVADPRGSGAIRRHDRTKIARPKSRAPQELTTLEYTPHDAADIWQLINEITDVGGGLNFLKRGLDAHRGGRPIELLPQQLRDQLLAHKKTHQSPNSAGHTSPSPPSKGK